MTVSPPPPTFSDAPHPTTRTIAPQTTTTSSMDMDSPSAFHLLPSPQLLRSLVAADSSPPFPDPSMSGMRRRPEAESDASEDEEEELGRRQGKKRRLSAKQVMYLEKSFEAENKLEPERKNQLAEELNLKPRQVAIWFQNRRARFKTKQLEKDYAVLKSTFDSLRTDYDRLLLEKDLLRNEVSFLRAKLKGASKSESPILTEAAKVASSVKSDVVDSESPNSASPEGSGYSQEDLTGSIMPVVDDYGFGVAGLEGQASYWPWPY